MDIKTTFRGMDHSPVLENYVNEKIAKIVVFLEHEREPIFIEVVLEAGRQHNKHRVEIRVKTPRYDLVNDYEGPEMYPVIDRVLDVMYNRLKEKKREFVDDRKKGDTFKGA